MAHLDFFLAERRHVDDGVKGRGAHAKSPGAPRAPRAPRALGRRASRVRQSVE